MLSLLTIAFLFLAATSTPLGVKNSRIIGGTPAAAGQFPYIAAIYKKTHDGEYFCAGSLFNSQWVLTAGQCVYQAESFEVHLGTHILNGDNPNRVIVFTSTYYCHEDYDPNTLNNDIGLIKFRMRVELTDYIEPVTFLGGNNLDKGTQVVVLGWGQTSDQTSLLSNELNYLVLSTISNDECRMLFGEQLFDHMVCVAGNYNEGLCHGDSGSPLILHNTSDSTFQGAIASFVSGNGCESTDPSGYTRTDIYHSWIVNTVTYG